MVGVPSTGAAFFTVTVVCDVTGGFTPSLADSVAPSTALSLHVTVGVSVAVAVVLHVVPGSCNVGVIVHPIVSGSFSGSLAVPVRCAAVPSGVAYGPPAFVVGGPFTRTITELLARPVSSSRAVTSPV